MFWESGNQMPKANVSFLERFMKALLGDERGNLITAFHLQKQKSGADMIIEFGLDGQKSVCSYSCIF